MKLSDHWASLACGALMLVNVACVALFSGGAVNSVAALACAGWAISCWRNERRIVEFKRQWKAWS